MNERMSSELIAILGVGATVLVVGVAILALGWNMYSSLNDRIDQVQAENHALNVRLDTMQAENQRQHDATRGEINQLRTEMNRRFDTMQAENQRQHDATRGEVSQLRTENQRQHDAIQEVLRVFEGRITRLEERTGIGAESAE